MTTYASRYYLQRYTGRSGLTGAVVFDVDPAPLPFPIERRHGSSHQVLPDYIGGVFVPGKELHMDGGVDVTSGRMTLNIAMATYATVSALKAIWRVVDAVVLGICRYNPATGLFDLDSGVVYTMAWDDGDSFRPEYRAGLKDFRLTMKFKILGEGLV